MKKDLRKKVRSWKREGLSRKLRAEKIHDYNVKSGVTFMRFTKKALKNPEFVKAYKKGLKRYNNPFRKLIRKIRGIFNVKKNKLS